MNKEYLYEGLIKTIGIILVIGILAHCQYRETEAKYQYRYEIEKCQQQAK